MKENMKHIFAGSLFVLVVLCGCAAAFSLFAAGISSLASADTLNQQPVSKQQTAVTSPPSPPASESEAIESSETTNIPQTKTYTKPDEMLARMHSPVGDAMDNGGVMVGQKVQQAFGSMLKGVLTTLFLEQSDSSPSSGTGGYNDGTTG